MEIARTIDEVRRFRRAQSNASRSGSLGLVPTMGALHAGHLSLVERAREQNDRVAVSIFVNPTQFGPTEDLSKYPRTFEADCRILEDIGVDLLFAPDPTVMYPPSFSAVVDVGPIGQRLDGASRPGHFAGVATVVAKLFNIFMPERAYFGQKDAAQIAVIRKLVRDLDFPVDIVTCPTVRAPSGLALSSRNQYLSSEQREQALVLSRALNVVQQLLAAGERSVPALLTAAHAVVLEEPAFRIDYIALLDPDTLESLPALSEAIDAETDPSPKQSALLALAGWLDSTRLIDNVLLRR